MKKKFKKLGHFVTICALLSLTASSISTTLIGLRGSARATLEGWDIQPHTIGAFPTEIDFRERYITFDFTVFSLNSQVWGTVKFNLFHTGNRVIIFEKRSQDSYESVNPLSFSDAQIFEI